MSGASRDKGYPPHPATVVQRRTPHAATVVQRKAPHAAQIDPASIQPKKRWTEKQRQQSEKFWEKKAARMRRQEEAERGLRARQNQRDSAGYAAEADNRILTMLGRAYVNPNFCLVSQMRILSPAEYAEVYAESAVEEYLVTNPDADVDTLNVIRQFARGRTAKEHAITTNGHVYIKQGHYALDTLVHEGIHLYGHDYFSHNACNRDSQGINEGMTEFFTREALGIKKRKPYSNEYQTARSIVGLVGHNVAMDAYFYNRIAEFKDAYHTRVGVTWERDYALVQALSKGGHDVLPIHRRK
jgi:hypothetical protein